MRCNTRASTVHKPARPEGCSHREALSTILNKAALLESVHSLRLRERIGHVPTGMYVLK